MAPGPMLGSKSQLEIQKEEESKRQNGNDGPAGKYSSRSSRRGGRDWYICWAKGHRVFSAIHLKTNCAAQAGAVKLHLGVEWILFLVLKTKKKGPPVLHVWPYAKSQAEEADRRNSLGAKRGKLGGRWGKRAETNEESRWERK